ncbi:MAG TPA: hypothetical protein VK136_00450 [Bacillota bacterium]|nr:hypothetical protein [Bacillota bacterium]
MFTTVGTIVKKVDAAQSKADEEMVTELEGSKTDANTSYNQNTNIFLKVN